MRQETPHEDLNPYAAPECVDPLPTDVFGAWHDGSMLVVHKQANLPRVCVVTGKPAAGARDLLLVWRPPDNILSQQTHLMVPLCRSELDRYIHIRWMALLGLTFMSAMVISMLAALAIRSNTDWVNVLFFFVAIASGMSGVALWCAAYFSARDPLSVALARGDYFWLSGTHPSLLKRLPNWPYDEGWESPR
jgi:hypothetical protein